MQFVEDSTLPVIGNLVGGPVLMAVLTAAGFCATLASGLASHASVSRMLLVMGRNNVLPQRAFGYINPRTHTPTFNIVLVGAISLLAIPFTLELIAAWINFGALIAFTFVNISVIAWFAIRKGRRKTPGDIFSFIVMPVSAWCSRVCSGRTCTKTPCAVAWCGPRSGSSTSPSSRRASARRSSPSTRTRR